MEIILIIGSYFFGALSPARIVGRAKGVNLCNQGTQNPGATNVYKLIGKGWGISIAFMDLFKGMIPTAIARIFFASNPFVLILTGIGAVAGHNWPIYYGFKGGRGLATSLGVFVVLDFRLILFTFIISIAISVYLKRRYGERIRIPFSLYPLLLLANVFFIRDWFLFTYTFILMVISFFRAWQVRHKLEDGTTHEADII